MALIDYAITVLSRAYQVRNKKITLSTGTAPRAMLVNSALFHEQVARSEC